MELLKVLAMPFQLPSLLFVAASSLLLGLLISMVPPHPMTMILMLFVIWLMLVWLTNYAVRLIDDAANGVRESATASVEMLTDAYLDSRAWVHPLIAIALTAMLLLRPQWPVAPTLLAGVVLLPASLGACTMSGHARDTLNLVLMWRVVRGLGLWYVPLVLFIALCALLGTILVQRLSPGAVLIASVQLLVLIAYAAIGGALYERRFELGFDPRVSPERVAEKLETERIARRQKFLDGLYNDLRVRESQRAIASARDWLGNAKATELSGDVHAILAAGRGWNELRHYPRLLEELPSILVALKQPALACTVAEAGLAISTNFNVGVETDVATLIGYALDTSRPRTAARLLDNFLKGGGPEYKPGPQISALRERIRSVV